MSAQLKLWCKFSLSDAENLNYLKTNVCFMLLISPLEINYKMELDGAETKKFNMQIVETHKN